MKLTSYNWLKEEKYITDFNISKVAIAKKRLSNINQVTWLQKLIKCLVYKESILVQHKLSVYKQGNMFVDDMYKKKLIIHRLCIFNKTHQLNHAEKVGSCMSII